MRFLVLVLVNNFFLLLTALFLGSLTGCGGPSKDDLVGTFTRDTPAVKEVLQINADGTFTQTVEANNGKTWTLADTWVLKPRGITFNLFYKTYDVEKQAAVIPPLKVMFRNSYLEGEFLVFSDVGDYVFRKESGK